jgi:ubiquinone/menaquinone biosynthesis C-methylase UbiE
MQQALSRLDRLAYRAQQLSFSLNAAVMQETARLLTRTPRAPVPPDVMAMIRRRTGELYDRDLENVRTGMYPRELLFQIPGRQYARVLPRLVLDTPRIVLRKKRGAYKDIPPVDKSRFPAYYRRTFHWQTDGYLSEHSAEMYDLGVELLFRGTADVMRRQVIPPVTRWLRERGLAPGSVRLLDIACGTGRTLRQMAAAHPALRFHGVDLSPYYVQAARKLLRDVGEVSLAVENAEQLPYADATFDVATSVYLFHELPRNARRNVIHEAWRVLKPGGLLVIEDSAQPSESPGLAVVLGNFSREFHEPFYQDYLEDDLADLLRERGFAVESVEPQLVAKVVVARKPA